MRDRPSGHRDAYPDSGGVGHEEVLRPGRLRRRQVARVVVRRRPETQVTWENRVAAVRCYAARMPHGAQECMRRALLPAIVIRLGTHQML